MQCLDDNQVSAYIARRLSSAEQQQIVDHLSSCDHCLTITCASIADEAVGPLRTFGRYQVLAVIDARTYLAHDPELRRDVLLKIGPRGAAVRHPNVIQILGTAEVDGEVVVALDLFGEPLAMWLATARPWQAIVRAFVAAGRGFVALGRDFTPDDVFVDAAGRVAVSPIGDGAVRDLAGELRAALGAAPVPRRVRNALRAPMPEVLDRIERALRPREVRRPVIAAGLVAASAAVVAVAWPGHAARAHGPDPIAGVIAGVERERLASLTAIELAAHRFPRALELARARGDRHALVIAELGSELLSEAAHDGGALVAESSEPAAEDVRALVAAHALLGHRDQAVRALDRLGEHARAQAATELAIYEGRLDDALATADPLAREMILARRGGRTSANGVLEARWPDVADDWLVHERRARASLDAGERERELRWCLDHRGRAALLSLALLPEVYVELARLTGTRAAWQAVVELGTTAQGDPWTAEARAHLDR